MRRARCGPGAGRCGPAATHERHARREGPAVKARGGRARAEHTPNMPPMSVTLDVSKLSGWLNTDAYCRVARSAYDAGGMQAGRRKGRGAAAAHAACRRRPEWGSVGAGKRGARRKHVLHICDFGQVETQRLVERRRPLPSRKERNRGRRHAGREVERAWGGRGACSVQARARMGFGGAGHARSAPETCSPWL